MTYLFFRKPEEDVQSFPPPISRSYSRDSMRSSLKRVSVRGETLKSSMLQRSSTRSRLDGGTNNIEIARL